MPTFEEFVTDIRRNARNITAYSTECLYEMESLAISKQRPWVAEKCDQEITRRLTAAMAEVRA